MTLNSNRRVACIGCGVIGSAWAGLFASRGLIVNVFDPSAEAEYLLREVIGRVMTVVDVVDIDPMDNVHFMTDLEEAVVGVSFIQESVPESLAVKRDLYSKLDQLAHASVPIASSTSDMSISSIQKGCAHAERMVVGHPINPPYAVELVEVVGGALTSEATIERALAFYQSVGRKPVRLNEEVIGFVANRLQMALFREAMQMIVRGQATVKQIDHVLMHGIGVRWAAVGIFGAYLLNIAECDTKAWLSHFKSIRFGESLIHDGDFSGLTDEIEDSVSRQWAARLGDKSVDDLLWERDRIVAAINHQRDDVNQG